MLNAEYHAECPDSVEVVYSFEACGFFNTFEVLHQGVQKSNGGTTSVFRTHFV
jgi:hypothetical protein